MTSLDVYVLVFTPFFAVVLIVAPLALAVRDVFRSLKHFERAPAGSRAPSPTVPHRFPWPSRHRRAA